MSLFSDLNSIYSIKQEIKSAIESKGVDMTNVSFPDYPAAIASISTAFVTETLSVTANGTYYPSEGVDGFSEVSVDVPAPSPVTQPLNVSVNGTYYPGLGYDGFSEVSVDVPQSVTGWTEKDVTEGNMIIVNLNNSASFVASSAFQGNPYLQGVQTVTLPSCSIVNKLAFANCSNLSSVSLSICQTIDEWAFSGTGIVTVDFPSLTTLAGSVFMNCKSLTYVSLPLIEHINYNTFSNCNNLSTVTLNNCINIARGGFGQCYSLQTLSLPVCEFIGESAFNKCSNLQSLDLPTCTTVGVSAFNQCLGLSVVSLSVCTMLSSYAFRLNQVLNSIYIYTSDVCSLQTGVFVNTPIDSGTGSIYVPSSLVDAYKSATNWSQYASQIFPIPE